MVDPESPTSPQKRGSVNKTGNRISPNGGIMKMLIEQNKHDNSIFDKHGQLDPRAFKRIIFEQQAGSLAGPKNSLQAATNKNSEGDFLEDNILLHGLKSHGITIEELLEANLQYIQPGAYEPIVPKHKTAEEFVQSVRKNLQSPVVRHLRSIVDIIKPKGYGLSKIGRHRSLPGRASEVEGQESTKAESPLKLTKLNVDTSQKPPLTAENGSIQHNLTKQTLETVTEEGHPNQHPQTQDITALLNSNSDSHVDISGIDQKSLTSDNEHDANETRDEGSTVQLPSTEVGHPDQVKSGLDPVPETDEHSQHNQNIAANQNGAGVSRNLKKGFHQKHQSVPRLGVVNSNDQLQKQSKLSNEFAASSKSPAVFSQMAVHNRSSTMKPDSSSVDRHVQNLANELDDQYNNEDRYITQTPFRQVQSNYQIQPHYQRAIVIPSPSMKNLKDVTLEEYYEIYKCIVRKYKRRERYGKEITIDPEEFNKLNDKGYKMKAERYKYKREKKRAIKRQKSLITGEKVAVRGDRGYNSSSSSSGSSHSSVSYGGVPEADIEYLKSEDKQDEINTRRNMRRAIKWQKIFDQAVLVDVKEEINNVILSQRANIGEESVGSSTPMIVPQRFNVSSEPTLNSSAIDISLNEANMSRVGPPAGQIFASSQAQMRGIMEQMGNMLKTRLLEDIDEEVPEEYLAAQQKDVTSQGNESFRDKTQTHTSLGTQMSSQQTFYGGGNDSLDQLEINIQNMMEDLVRDIEANGSNEDKMKAQEALNNSKAQSTVPSFLCNQASYIAARSQLGHRMNKFLRTNNTSPRFYDNDTEHNQWIRKMATLDKGKVDKIFPNNKRIESFQKLANHMRSKNLIPTQAATDVPRGFNQSMPMDQVTHELGKHILQRTETLKAQTLDRSQSLSPSSSIANGVGTAIHLKVSPMSTLPQGMLPTEGNSSAMQVPINRSIHQLNHPSSQVLLDPANVASTQSTQMLTMGPKFSKRNSDQLLSDVNAVFQYLSKSRAAENSQSVGNLQKLEDQQKRELQDCIVIEKPPILDHDSSNLHSKQMHTKSQLSINQAICHCNHMAPHRHIYMKGPYGRLEDRKDTVMQDQMRPNTLVNSGSQHHSPSLMIVSQEEPLDQDSNKAKILLNQASGSGRSIQYLDAIANKTPQSKSPPVGVTTPGQFVIAANASTAIKQEEGAASSSGGHITPLGLQPKVHMTDRNWNNSELRKFSVTQSKSNADILEELRRAQMPELMGHLLQLDETGENENDEVDVGVQTGVAQGGETTDEDVRTAELQKSYNMGPAPNNPLNQNRKGKTLTVLFKSDLRRKGQDGREDEGRDHIETQPALEVSGSKPVLHETPAMQRDNSKEDYLLRPNIMQSARYNDQMNNEKDEKQSVEKRDKKKPSVARNLHRINIMQNLGNSGETQKDGLGNSNYQPNIRLSARNQQVLSVSVKNIELPDQYRVSSQQKPKLPGSNEQLDAHGQNSPIESKGSKQNKLHEVGLQTNFQTQNSFFKQGNTPTLPKDQLAKPDDSRKYPNQVVVVNSQMEKYAEHLVASQPTIETESEHKMHAMQQMNTQTTEQKSPSKPPVLTIENERDDTKLLILTQNTGRQPQRTPNQKSKSPVQDLVNRGLTPNSPTDTLKAQSPNNSRPSPIATLNERDDIFKVRGIAQKMQLRKNLPTNAASQSKSKAVETKGALTVDELRTTQGNASQFEVPKPKYPRNAPIENASIGSATDGTQYGSMVGGTQPRQKEKLDETQKYSTLKNIQMPATRKDKDKNAEDKKADDPMKTDRVVRNFKPSKLRKQPEAAKNHEIKQSQLADSNVTPLGLFNQDLHAKREWNKLMAQKNFSATLTDKQMTFKDTMIQEIMMPLAAPIEANKTSQGLPLQVMEGDRREEYSTVGKSNERSKSGQDRTPLLRTNQEKFVGDNSTLMSNSNSGDANQRFIIGKDGTIKPQYGEPRVTVQNDKNISATTPNALRAKVGAVGQQPSPRKQQQLNVKEKVPHIPQSTQHTTSKVIVFNFRGNTDLPEDIIRPNGINQSSQNPNDKNMLIGSSSSRNMLSPFGSASRRILSPTAETTMPNTMNRLSSKRNSSVNHNNSVSIYNKAKALLNQTQGDSSSQNLMKQGGPSRSILKGSSTHEIILKEERTRYKTTVRKRVSDQTNPTSLSTAKFLMSRRNPEINSNMMSQKVSPFKPLGGGFKQNLNVEVSQSRIEREVAEITKKHKTSSSNAVHFGGYRASRHISNNTLDLAINDSAAQNDTKIGFNIERATLNRKQRQDIKDLPEFEQDATLSSKTKEKINKSALSQLNQALGDFKASDASSNDDRKSASDLPCPPTLDEFKARRIDEARASKSSTQLNSPANRHSSTVQNFEVPKMALMPKPVQEAIQTNDSFAKIINDSPNKKKLSMSRKNSNATKTASMFANKKQSIGIPYPIKNSTIGENLHQTSFNLSNRFASNNPSEEGASPSTMINKPSSPRLEGTKMRLTQKSTIGDIKAAPFDKEPESQRKRLSPKTLATIKGGTKENPIKVESPPQLYQRRSNFRTVAVKVILIFLWNSLAQG